MRIYPFRQISFEPTTLVKQGEVLIVNGQELDFSPLPDGGEIPWFAFECQSIRPYDSTPFIRRIYGEVHIGVVLTIHPDETNPALLQPMPIDVLADGPVALPVSHVNVVQEELEEASDE